MSKYKIVLTAVLAMASVPSQAGWWGAPDGRSANPANNPQISVEGTISKSTDDYQNIGGRVNYTINESLTVFGDFSKAERAGDGTAFGAGAYYSLPQLSEIAPFFNNKDFAVQGSYHRATLDFDLGGRVSSWEVDVSALSVSLLMSPKTAFKPDIGLNWYATAGFTRLAFDRPGRVYVGNEFIRTSGSSNSIEPHIGGGVYMPLGPGTIYAGADRVQELILGIGYRYGIK